MLLVEDDESLRSALRFALEVDGFEVWAFETAEALLAVDPLPVNGLLVLDQHLPGLSGLDLLKALRARDVDMPVVLITTSTRAIRETARSMGAPLVEKPLVDDSLIRQVRGMASRIKPARTAKRQPRN